MLKSLYIKNIVLIDKYEIEFAKGFNVLSGETGAGKSIIVDAMKFLLGSRADKSIIRFGEESAKVQGDFDIKDNEKAQQFLKEFDIECEDSQLLAERTLNQDGKSVCRLNGEKVTLSVYKDIISSLVDICGQNENTTLLDERKHIYLLDIYDFENISKYKDEYVQKYNRYISIKKELQEILSIKDVDEKIKNYKKEIMILDEAELKPGEEKELEELNDIYQNSESILSNLTTASNILSSYDDENISINSLLSESQRAISQASKYSKKLENIQERLDSLSIEIQDLSNDLSDCIGEYDYDENQATWVYERLNMIYTLKRKYGVDFEELIKYREELQNKINSLEDIDYKKEVLKKEKETVLDDIYKIYQSLRQIRENLANNLEVKITNELHDLNMKSAVFKVLFNDKFSRETIEDGLTKKGIDSAIFMISTNKGQELKPLIKIASGGEMSRIMLALKNVLTIADKIETVIFDEIDTGISGITANILGNKLELLSKSTQIILITHLASIAALADKHFYIEKYEENSNTYSTIKVLDKEERIKEIARLISGDSSSKTSIEQANELIKRKK